MLFSYSTTPTENLPQAAKLFLRAVEQSPNPSGMMLTYEALQEFLSSTSLDRELEALVNAVDDEESRTRVDKEIKRRVVTGRVDKQVAESIKEVVDVLGLHKDDFSVAEIPLLVQALADRDFEEPPVVINVTGAKALADAVRLMWAKSLVSPHDLERPIAVAVSRMPPAESTATVQKVADGYRVRAVLGWGRLVGTDEDADEFLFDESLQLTSKTVSEQKSMIARNDRTEQIVKTVPMDGSVQKITDSQARELCVLARKTGLGSAVFALREDRLWLLRALSEQKGAVETEFIEIADEPEDDSQVVEEPQPVQEEETPADEEEGDVEVYEESEPDTEDTEEEFDESDDEPEDLNVEIVEMEEPEHISREQRMQEEAEDNPDEDDVPYGVVEDETTASGSFQQTKQMMTAAIMQAYKTIELTMREWLEGSQPEDFEDLVLAVAEKRQVPYKQRVLSLYEMRKQAAFEDPDADTVRFALETMERFVREF